MRNLLITGGAGFIGSNYVRYVLQNHVDLNVVVFDKLTYAGNLDNLRDIDEQFRLRYRFVKGDICDAGAVSHTLREYQIDTIVNFAAESHVDRSLLTPDAFIKTAVNGTHVQLESAKAFFDRAFADLHPEEGVIFLRQPDGEFQRVAQRRLPGVTGEFLYSRSLAREVTEKGLAALVVDVSADERFNTAQSIMTSGVRSLVAAPLLDPSGCPGLIVLSSRIQVRSFTEEDMEELVSLAAAAAMRIRNIALAEEAAKKQVLEKELALARQIQMTLLPAELPVVPGFELRASNIPTRAVSGDLYQVQMRRDDKECVVLLADVSGKGVPSAGRARRPGPRPRAAPPGGRGDHQGLPRPGGRGAPDPVARWVADPTTPKERARTPWASRM